MRQLSTGLKDHLDTGATTTCLCWQLTRKDGTVMGFTDHDGALSFDGVTFEPETGFSGTALETSLGLSVDTQDVNGALRSGMLEETDLAAGVYDDARIDVWFVNWADIEQRLLLRTGNLGEVVRGPLGFSAEVRGLAHRLNQVEGRTLQYACDAEFGDARCGFDAGDPTVFANAQVASVNSKRRFSTTGLEGFAPGWFAQGSLTFTSGTNLNWTSRVRAHEFHAGEHVLELDEAPPHAISGGMGFSILAGCDKRLATCTAKFANAVNFRGFPHMPGNDFVFQYPTPGAENENS